MRRILLANGPTILAAVLSAWFIVELARGGVPWTPAFFAAAAGLWALARRYPGRLWSEHPASAVFLTALAIYLSTFRWHGGDDAPNSLIPFCLLRHGTLTLDPVLQPWFGSTLSDFTLLYEGRRLSMYPVMPGLLAIPLYLIPALDKAVVGEQFLHNLSKLSGSILTALSAVFLFRSAVKRCSRDWALAVTGLYALGSWALSVSSQSLWQHGPAALGVAIGLFALEGETRASDMLAGFGFALAVACRPDSVLFAGAAAAALLISAPRRLLAFFVGALPAAFFLAWYWIHYTGRLRPPDGQIQSAMFTGFSLEAFMALLASPTRGLFFFFPAAPLAIWAALRPPRRALKQLMLLSCAGIWLMISCYGPWVGGETFGTRYFAVVALVLCYLLADADAEEAIRARPALLAFWCWAAAVSVLIHALGAYLNWPGSFELDPEKANVWNWTLHPILDVLVSNGALRGLPLAVRGSILILLLGATACGAQGLRRRLAAAPISS